MKTIALRFGETFAPECGTIQAHQEVLDNLGYVWYGKMGAVVSKKMIDEIMGNEKKQILLIRSGHKERYWLKIESIQYSIPEKSGIPEYYRDIAGTFKTWFKVKEIVLAPKTVMSKCTVASSGRDLGEVSRHSMSPYFIINYEEGGD